MSLMTPHKTKLMKEIMKNPDSRKNLGRSMITGEPFMHEGKKYALKSVLDGSKK